MKALALCVALIAGIEINAIAAVDGSKLDKARKHFEAADAMLNTTYKSLCKELSKEKLAALREGQRDWLHYRDEMSAARSSNEQEDVPLKHRSDYWEIMAGLTEERTGFLSAYSGKNIPGGITGEYHDSYGGTLQLEEKKDGIAFSIDVVRGQAQNEGEMDGVAIRKGSQASFKDKVDSAEPEGKPCEILFTFIDGHIVKVEEKVADKNQGYNVHFDGDYYKTGALKKSIKLE